MLAARVPTLTASISPVLVGTAAAAGDGVFHPLPALAALVGAVAIQVGTNYHNDALDFLHGADSTQRRGPTRVTAAGLLPARWVLLGSYASFGLAALAGLYLVALRGWPVLVAGLLSISAAVAYTASPLRLGYRGLGDLLVFIFFGVVAVVGSDYVQTGAVRAPAALASVPVGLLTTAILVANNLRDIETDRAAGKRTLAVRVGVAGTRVEYALCVAVAFAVPGLMRAAGAVGAWFWLPWLAAPLAALLVYAVFVRHDSPSQIWVLKRTAGLLLIFSVLLALALARGRG
ncbi:MAG: 1,4-dihydroxy-2-naphthoate polyprenyltransferase [Armatimonadota bacterium]|nr:1,4-dihydroxy-2-naphthoate polyprenyltransferase [Armatimonadota bacterium]MDR7544021.1 1,4-dihydroxy-2-naphthoate polyprenyltransferase [Armatimonadota bacterium]